MVYLLMEPTLITDIMKTVNFVYLCILSKAGREDVVSVK